MTNLNLPALTPERRQTILSEFAKVQYAKMLGLELETLQTGAATLVLPVCDQLKQNLGVVHGGAIASLIDTAAAFAALTVLENGEKTTTTDLTIQYLRPLTQGRARARATIRRAGRRVIALAVDVFDHQDKLAATALTTYLRL